MEDSEKNLDFDTILDLVGGGGKWQWRKLFWLAPAHIAYGIPLLLHLFTAYAPSHRCYVQNCDSALNPDFHAGFLNFSTPTDHASSTFLRDAEDYDPCQTYVQTSPICHPRAFNPHAKQNCSSFVYDQSEFSATLTTKLDLVCDKVNVRHSLGSIMMFGLLTGSLIVKLRYKTVFVLFFRKPQQTFFLFRHQHGGNLTFRNLGLTPKSAIIALVAVVTRILTMMSTP